MCSLVIEQLPHHSTLRLQLLEAGVSGHFVHSCIDKFCRVTDYYTAVNLQKLHSLHQQKQ